MIKDISQSIEELVAQIDTTINGTYDAINMRTNVCKTKWARVGKFITDQNGSHLITDIDYDNYLIADQANGVIQLAPPYFVPGTRISANMEWTKLSNDLTQKTPLIWLLHDIGYTVYGRESVYNWESDLRIFFLDETDIVNYYTKDHIQNVVIPMSELANEFINVVNQNRAYLTLEDYEIKNFTRFGNEQSNGYFSNILDANLSGVELRIKLTKYKENCKC
jgi:hypothetical protein